MSVRLVPVPRHQLPIDSDVELSVIARNEPEGLDLFSRTAERLTRHPGGPECVTSVLAVLDLDIELFVGHGTGLRFRVGLMISVCL